MAIPWEVPDSSRGANEQTFVEALHDHFLTQIQRKPTRGTNVLDLVITSVPDQTTLLDVLDINNAGLFTDHRTSSLSFTPQSKRPPKRTDPCMIMQEAISAACETLCVQSI